MSESGSFERERGFVPPEPRARDVRAAPAPGIGGGLGGVAAIETRRWERAAAEEELVATIRRARPGDLGALYLLINLAYMRERWLLPGPRIMKQDLAAEMSSSSNLFIVADTSVGVIGTLRIRLEASPAGGQAPSPFFGLFAVAPMFQGRGVGRRLVMAAEQVALSRGFGKLHLQCGGELGMVGYYEAMGFKAIKEDFGLHSNSMEPFTLVTMMKELGTRTQAKPSIKGGMT